MTGGERLGRGRGCVCVLKSCRGLIGLRAAGCGEARLLSVSEMSSKCEILSNSSAPGMLEERNEELFVEELLRPGGDTGAAASTDDIVGISRGLVNERVWLRVETPYAP